MYAATATRKSLASCNFFSFIDPESDTDMNAEPAEHRFATWAREETRNTVAYFISL